MGTHPKNYLEVTDMSNFKLKKPSKRTVVTGCSIALGLAGLILGIFQSSVDHDDMVKEVSDEVTRQLASGTDKVGE